jgi:peptidoglycan-N-acetylglucosamine deacetylase
MTETLMHRAMPSTPLIRGSVALHVAAAGAVVLRPQWWPWALSAVIADHLCLTAAGLSPRSTLLGPNWVRLPAGPDGQFAHTVALTLDDGPDPEVTPRTLDVLAEHRARATFFCIGERVAAHPQLARRIVAEGHTIGNHSYRHSHRFSLMGPGALRGEVLRAQQVIESTTGQTPAFFRAPAGLRNVFLEPILARAGLRLVSWTRRGFDTVTTEPGPVLARLTRNLSAGNILLLHDGHAARGPHGRPVVLAVLPQLLEVLAAARLAPITLSAALAAAGPGT